MVDFTLENNCDFFVTDIGFMIERKPNEGWRIDRLTNTNYYILAYSITGEAIYNFNGKIHSVKQGDLLFFPKNLIHTGYSRSDNPWGFYSVAFDVKFANKSSAEKFNDMSNLLSIANMHKLPILFSELNHAWMGKRTGYLVKCRSVLMEILYLMIAEMDFSAHQTPHYQTIESTINMIHTNYANYYSIDELAALSGLSSSHFRVLFKKITGMTAIQYQNNIKINKAKDLLLSGDCNVSEAAVSTGFNDIYYFSRLFKKTTGMNPSDYLKL